MLVALGLKLMDLKSTRDYYVLVFLTFFVALTQFLFNQKRIHDRIHPRGLLATRCYADQYEWGVLEIRYAIQDGRLFDSPSHPGHGLPICFFPRITTPQFGLHDEDQQAVSGLSSVLEPGKFSRLSLSRKTAFRVTFSGEVPPPEQRYWRGPVFWNNEGRRWTLPEQNPAQPGGIRFQGKPYHYSIVLEPHQQKWLFALDLPSTLPTNAYQTNELVLLSKTTIKKRRAYQLTSNPIYNSGHLSESDRDRGLQLATPPSHRVLNLLGRWKSGDSGPEQLVRKSLAYFHNEPFVYTLTPPRLDGNPVEQFLFETQKGYCEHYATSFVVFDARRWDSSPCGYRISRR